MQAGDGPGRHRCGGSGFGRWHIMRLKGELYYSVDKFEQEVEAYKKAADTALKQLEMFSVDDMRPHRPSKHKPKQQE